MKISVWKIFSVFGIISAWSQQALADKVVTLEEALDLVAQLALALGLPMAFDASKVLEKENDLPG